MYRLSVSFLVALVFVAAVSGAGHARADIELERPSENIASGASYTMAPGPSYRLCLDKGDRVQLTDGVYAEGYFWTQDETVGWKGGNPVVITVDLGAVEPIRGVSYNTAAGVAGVHWPSAICIMVAGEDKTFYEAGELTSLSAEHGIPPDEGYATHRYWTDDLRTHGRYVAFVVSGHPYTFVDEVEVYVGEEDWVELPLKGAPVTDIRRYMVRLQVLGGVRRRLRHDTQNLRQKVQQADIEASNRGPILAGLADIEKQIPETENNFGDDFRAVLPLTPLHERLFALQAGFWRAMGHSGCMAWQTPLWEPLSHLDDPPADSPPTLDVHMMRNEYRAAAFNVSNTTPERIAFDLRITGLPAGTNPEYVTVHEVEWTDTHAGKPVAAALPAAERRGDAYLINVPAGLTRQVWFTFHPVDVAPGEHAGRITLSADGHELGVPITLRVYPLEFPDEPRLHFGGWDYTDCGWHRGVTPANRDALIAHLRERFVDSPWATSGVIPRSKHDSAGAMVEQPDTANFDAWLKLWPDAGQYCIFASVGDHYGDWAMSTPEFARAVGDWARFWAEHAREQGVNPDKIHLLLVDEPHRPEQDKIILAWANAIHKADTGMNVWEDPVYRDMSKADPDMIAACDVLCPNRVIYINANQAYRDYFAERRREGATLQFYSCSGPARLLDPYAYYRLQAWTCWTAGADASYFWAFGDNSGVSAWNEYAAPRNVYTPSFLDDTSVTPAKQLEAAREGIEDYEYFAMLREAIQAAEQRGAADDLLDSAQRLLEQGPENVLESATAEDKSLMWHDARNRTLADKVRIDVLDKLVELAP